VGLRVRTRVGAQVEPGEPLFDVHAKAGATVDPAPYLATLRITDGPVTPGPWLLERLGD
jgi:thymidine phosphorylase